MDRIPLNAPRHLADYYGGDLCRRDSRAPARFTPSPRNRPLPGLFNRRYMEESPERDILRAGRNNTEIGILLLDVDHFKRYNDTFGHEAGDSVLREVGALLQKQARGDDIACRFGGEEFVLIMPGSPRDVARERAEGILDAARKLAVNFHGQTLGAITISIGVASYPEQGRTSDSVLETADKALYKTKESARDRTVFATPVAHDGWSWRSVRLQPPSARPYPLVIFA